MATDREGIEIQVGDAVIISGKIRLIDGKNCVIEQIWSDGTKHGFWVSTDCIDRLSTEDELREFANQSVLFDKYVEEIKLMQQNNLGTPQT